MSFPIMIAFEFFLVGLWAASIPPGGPMEQSKQYNAEELQTNCVRLQTAGTEIKASFVLAPSIRKASSIYALPLIKESSGVLTPLKKQLEEQLNWLEENRGEIFRDQLVMARKHLQDINQEITNIRYYRLMQLGGEYHTKLPDDLLESNILQKNSNSVVERVMNLITDFKILSQDEEFSLARVRVPSSESSLEETAEGFNVFAASEVIEPQGIRSIFQDEKIVREFVLYAARKPINRAILEFKSVNILMDNLTKQRFWTNMNKFTAVLGEKEKDFIDFVYLVEMVKSENNKIPNIMTSQSDVESFDQCLCAESTSANSPLPTLRWRLNSRNEEYHWAIDYQNPYLGLARTHQTRDLEDVIVAIVNLFGFMEKELYPGIVSELLKNEKFLHPMCQFLRVPSTYTKPTDYFDLISLHSRIGLLETTTKYAKISDSQQNIFSHLEPRFQLSSLPEAP
ncbi:hypothetical protein PSHT_02430 [Puccinia striiformis]|uniref:Uncharacterized protein n=1 Tax=Puccinia striiformis TaxID=27350 RepID=A0A2S4WHX0_9BASI|nr:hypothetical protein PSHT_02430 [Puccinia striiformis]